MTILLVWLVNLSIYAHLLRNGERKLKGNMKGKVEGKMKGKTKGEEA